MRALWRVSSAASVTGSAVRSSPSPTTSSPPTSSASTGRVGPNASAATGSAMPAKPSSPRSQSATSASAPTLRCPSSSSRPRQRAPWRVASSSAWRAVSAAGPPATRASMSAARSSSTSSPRLVRGGAVDAEPDGRARGEQRRDGRDARAQPAVGGRAVRDAGAGRAHPLRLAAVEVDAVREPDVVAEPAQAVEVLERPLRRSARGRTSSSSWVSARCVCRRTPRARASSAVSAISSPLTEKGDVGASAIRTIAPGSGSWKRSIAAALAARIASRSSTMLVGRQAALAAAEVHRAAARVEAQPDRPRGLDLDRQQVAGVAREDVVVVGRGRAARARQRGEPGAGGGVDDRVVDVRPDGVERDEPLEQRRLLRIAARRVLVEVVVAVDEPGRGELAAPVDPPRPLRHGRRRARADGRDPAVLADHVAVRELAPRVVHGRDRAALDDGDAGSQSGGIYSLRRSSRSRQPIAWTAKRSWRASAVSSKHRRGSPKRPGSAARSAASSASTRRWSAVVGAAPPADRLALIRAHPDLAGKAAIAGALTPESTREQAAAGLDRLTPAQYERITGLTAAYRERFGFPFVVCAREHTADSIIASAAAAAGSRPRRGGADRAVRDREDRPPAARRPGASVTGARISYGKLEVPVHCVGVAPLHGLPEIPESPLRSLDSGLLACEVSMEVLGQGFLAAYTEGDNSNVVATDTMKNVILRRALEYDGPTLEGFLDELGRGVPRHLSGDGGPAAVGARAAVRAGPGRRARGAQRPALLARRRRPRGRRARARARRGRQRRARRAAQRAGRAAAAQDDRIGVHEVRARRRDDAARARRPAAVHPPRRALALRGSRPTRSPATRPATSPPAQVRDVVCAVFHEFVSESIQHLVHEMGQRLLDRFRRARRGLVRRPRTTRTTRCRAATPRAAGARRTPPRSPPGG